MRALLLWVCLFTSCKHSDPDPCDSPTVPTWHNFAQGHVRTWCSGCHSSSVEGISRQGAPDGLDFDRWSQVYDWRERIAIRSTGPDPDMPPLGGIARENVDRFDSWLSCGAKGEDDPPDACDTLTEQGSFTVASGEDAAALCAGGNAVLDLTVTGSVTIDCLCAINGDLQVVSGTLDAPQLERISGDLSVGGATALRAAGLQAVDGGVQLTGPLDEVVLPALAAVGGDLIVSDTTLPELSLDALYSVGGGVNMSRSSLVRLDLPRLRTVGTDLVIQDLPELVSLEGTRALTSIGGSLVLARLSRLPVLDDWSFLLLTSVGGDVIIADSAQLVAIHGLTLLAQVPGDLRIEDLPNLARIEGFDLLLTVGGDLSIARNAEQIDIAGFINLEDIDGALQLSDLASLQSIPGFGALTSTGALHIERTGMSTLADLPLLATIDDELDIDANPVLSSISGLGALALIGGPAQVTNNPALSTALVDAWLAGIPTIGGPITVEGNAP